jgi:hypothetical protein
MQTHYQVKSIGAEISPRESLCAWVPSVLQHPDHPLPLSLPANASPVGFQLNGYHVLSQKCARPPLVAAFQPGRFFPTLRPRASREASAVSVLRPSAQKAGKNSATSTENQSYPLRAMSSNHKRPMYPEMSLRPQICKPCSFIDARPSREHVAGAGAARKMISTTRISHPNC